MAELARTLGTRRLPAGIPVTRAKGPTLRGYGYGSGLPRTAVPFSTLRYMHVFANSARFQVITGF